MALQGKMVRFQNILNMMVGVYGFQKDPSG